MSSYYERYPQAFADMKERRRLRKQHREDGVLTEEYGSVSRVTRKYLLKRKYGITIEEHDEMLDRQNNACAICGGGTTDGRMNLCVDHDHKTNKVRGLLCSKCNTGLGFMRDSPDLLRAAADYIERHKD